MLFPPPIPPPVVSSHPVDECPSHPLECASRPIDCCSHPLLDDFDEDDYDSSLEEEEEASMTEVEHGSQLPTLGGTLHLSSVLLWPLPFSFAQSPCSSLCIIYLYLSPCPFSLHPAFPLCLSPSSSRFPLEAFLSLSWGPSVTTRSSTILVWLP